MSKGKARTRTARRDLMRVNTKNRNRIAKVQAVRDRVKAKSYEKQTYDGSQEQDQEQET